MSVRMVADKVIATEVKAIQSTLKTEDSSPTFVVAETYIGTVIDQTNSREKIAQEISTNTIAELNFVDLSASIDLNSWDWEKADVSANEKKSHSVFNANKFSGRVL